MASKSGRPSRPFPEDDGETRVQRNPTRLGFERDPQAASPSEATGRIDVDADGNGNGNADGNAASRNALPHESTDDGQPRSRRGAFSHHDELPHEDTVPPPERAPERLQDAETRVSAMPDLEALKRPRHFEDESSVPPDGETRVSDAAALGLTRSPTPTTEAETRVATSPVTAYPESLNDAETRVGSIPGLGAYRPAASRDSGDASDASDPGDETRVAPSPQFGSSGPAASPRQAYEASKPERRNIPTVDLPADLRLPTFDFKLSSSPDVAAAKAAGVHTQLPAHLQLPTFPDLGKPPVAKNGVSVPPPVPKKAAPPPLPQVADLSPPVIDLSLPKIASRPTQRNLTLISGKQKDGRTLGKRLMWPFIVAGVCAVIALGLFLGREQVIAVLAPKRPPVVAPPPTAQERAQTALAAGNMAYVAKDYQVAIHHFEVALTDDPRLVEAHRSLGIVYATLHDQAKAVRHYQDYLALSPHAPDATEVLKIVEDYKHAQAKAAHEAAKPPPEPAKHHKAHGAGHRK